MIRLVRTCLAIVAWMIILANIDVAHAQRTTYGRVVESNELCIRERICTSLAKTVDYESANTVSQTQSRRMATVAATGSGAL